MAAPDSFIISVDVRLRKTRPDGRVEDRSDGRRASYRPPSHTRQGSDELSQHQWKSARGSSAHCKRVLFIFILLHPMGLAYANKHPELKLPNCIY
jgi:hypothetical protein